MRRAADGWRHLGPGRHVTGAISARREDPVMAGAGGIQLEGPVEGRFAEILTPAALAFVAELERELGPTRDALLRRRVERQAAFDAGERLAFLPETRATRKAAWSARPAHEGQER